MFWKKKTKAEGQDVFIELEDQRASFRYVFKKEDQISMTFKGETVRIYDISAGGLAFQDKGFAKYDAEDVSLHLEMPNFCVDCTLNAQVRILHITENHTCHSIFENCSVDDYEKIHKYVLEMQKRDLRQR